MPKKLTVLSPREKAFVVAFCGEAAGNATKSATLAGYKKSSARFQGSKLSKKSYIQAAIATFREQAASAADERSTIADAAERREILSAIARSKHEEPRDRIKAADVLNKMDGLYVLKHQHEGTVTLEHILGEAGA